MLFYRSDAIAQRQKKPKFTFDLVFEFEIHFEFDFEFDFLRWQERLLVLIKLPTASETICKGKACIAICIFNRGRLKGTAC